jgi:hypothetical protein
MAESGQGENYTSALVSTLDRAGYPITRIPLLDAGLVLDLSAFTDPLLMAADPGLADDPKFDFWFGSNPDVMALGTAPSVQFALAPDTETLATTEAYQHAVESVFLPGAQALAFVNVGALAGIEDLPADFTRLVESLSASAFADAEGVTGRVAVTLK